MHQNGSVDANQSMRLWLQRKRILLKAHLSVYDGAKDILKGLKTQTLKQWNGYECLKIVGEALKLGLQSESVMQNT